VQIVFTPFDVTVAEISVTGHSIDRINIRQTQTGVAFVGNKTVLLQEAIVIQNSNFVVPFERAVLRKICGITRSK